MSRLPVVCFSLFISGLTFAAAAPKNIILLIGDGMGEAEIALTRAYEFDSEAGLFVDTMKNTGSVIVKQFMVADPSKIEFAGSSGSGGTTISTGNRTSEERVAVKAEDGSHYKTILEEAQELGFKTGLVATSIIADATPATFAAHTQNRYCYMQGLKDCEEYGETPIIEQMLDQNVDVMLGGGYNLLPANTDENITVKEKAERNGYTVITTRDELMNIEVGTKTLGVFFDGTMPVEWQEPGGKGADFIAVDKNRNIIYPQAAACEVNPAHANMPHLEEMAHFAIESLHSADGAGFFLMIESASIDKQAHNAMPCGVIGEMLAFDRTVKMAAQYAKRHGDTAVIVTADHGQATQVIYKPVADDGPESRDHLPGLYQLLLTKGGNELNTYYGTNNLDDQSHTGINVPIYTYGLDNPEALTGVIQQTEIYGVMKDFLFN